MRPGRKCEPPQHRTARGRTGSQPVESWADGWIVAAAFLTDLPCRVCGVIFPSVLVGLNDVSIREPLGFFIDPALGRGHEQVIPLDDLVVNASAAYG